LRDESKFRAWVYAIARNEVRAKARARSRHVREEYAPEQSVDPDFAGDHDRRELASLINEAVAGLTEREQEVFHLFARQGLSNDEIAASLELSFVNAQKLVQRVRDRIARSAGALLVARQGRKDCSDLNVLLVDWDGTFSPLWRKRIARHVDECQACEKRRAVILQPGGAVMAAPYFAAPESLRSRIFDSVAAGVDLGLSRVPGSAFFRRPGFLTAVAGIAVLGVIGVVANNGGESPRLVEAPPTSIVTTVPDTVPAIVPVIVPETTTTAPTTTVPPTVSVATTPPPTPAPTAPPATQKAQPSTTAPAATAPAAVTTTSPATTAVAPPVPETTIVVETTAANPATPVAPTTVLTAAAPVAPATTTTSTTAAPPQPVFGNSPSKIEYNSCVGFGKTAQKSFGYSVKVTDPQGIASARMQLRGATTWHAAGSFASGIWFTVIDKVDLAATKATVVVEVTDKAGGVTTAQFAVYPTTCP
jgi:DNA-binding CsgD family transcriptional regulator/outer membrane biosynthesis protein TonB